MGTRHNLPAIPEEILRLYGGKIRLEFYRGLKAIGNFLNCHEKTAAEYARSGLWPIKRDPSGTWVLCNLDYYLCLGVQNDQ